MAEQATVLFTDAGLNIEALIPDYAGIPRVLTVRLSVREA